MKLLFITLLIGTSAFSQTMPPLKKASVNDLVEKLAPSNDQPRTRSLGSRNLAPTSKSIDLVIQFDLDSAKLQAASKPLLDNLASAMKSDRLTDIRFKVEGHTDVQGTEEHNLKLSLNRADTVLEYLVSQGVEKVRLVGEGKGYSELLVPEKPKAAENRRVRISTLP
jgi:outer membrane protein OmpA-like peptidoglycan-associated protein